MRERITFVHDAEDDFNPSQLQLENNALTITSLNAAREDRVTFSTQELPQELWRVLKQCHELHIRWSSLSAYLSVSPFNARVSPGFHLFYTPQKNRSADLLCPLLNKVFGSDLQCESPEKTFIGLPVTSERFATSAAYQYYQLMPSLGHLQTYFREKICPALGNACLNMVVGYGSADHVDIDFDTISQALSISTFRHKSPEPSGWNERISSGASIKIKESVSVRIGVNVNVGGSVKSGAGRKIEVGVLANEPPTELENLSLGGFLTVVGEDEKPSPTLFSFPARHHRSPPSSISAYSTTLLTPTGLHPTLRLTFSSSPLSPPASTCALHTYLTLPSVLFPDKYQLSSPLFLASKNLRTLRSLAGETDLEAPDWAVSKWGSAMLVELAPPGLQSQPSHAQGYGGEWHADIPLHIRYLRPSESGHATAELPWPVVFWACTAEEGSKMAVNPFDRVNLGYDGLFGPKTMFYHLEPALEGGNGSGRLVERIDVPVLQTGETAWVEIGTVAVVLAGFLWVIWKLGTVLMGRQRAAMSGAKKKTQ